MGWSSYTLYIVSGLTVSHCFVHAPLLGPLGGPFFGAVSCQLYTEHPHRERPSVQCLAVRTVRWGVTNLRLSTLGIFSRHVQGK